MKAAGLKIKIDTTGLKDSKVDYTNVSSSGDNESSSNVSTDIQSLSNEIVGSETDEYKKFEKLHDWGCKKIKYSRYDCSNHNNDPDECLKNKTHLNCGDTSILMKALYDAQNIKNHITHGNNHFWNIVTINGKKYCSDCSGNNGHPIGEVWGNNTPLGGSKVKGYNLCS